MIYPKFINFFMAQRKYQKEGLSLLRRALGTENPVLLLLGGRETAVPVTHRRQARQGRCPVSSIPLYRPWICTIHCCTPWSVASPAVAPDVLVWLEPGGTLLGTRH
uniref:Uncharacterized protein n=1 Tax=Arundo donax TaxID=35708 RepID=A0A0A9LCX7_ARUDO